jgi:CRISPR-associated protein Cas2
MIFGGLDSVWLVVMFDLPTDSKKARKSAADFRKSLLDDGFSMMQYSVYSRHCPSKENAEVHKKRIKGCLPPDGEVRILQVTEKQHERMQIFWGKRRKPTKNAPSQLEMF